LGTPTQPNLKKNAKTSSERIFAMVCEHTKTVTKHYVFKTPRPDVGYSRFWRFRKVRNTPLTWWRLVSWVGWWLLSGVASGVGRAGWLDGWLGWLDGCLAAWLLPGWLDGWLAGYERLVSNIRKLSGGGPVFSTS